jgi:curli biogenesis system outer membrane secretion channel CsgG
VDNNWRDRGPSTESLRRAIGNLLAREQSAARAKLDLMRAVEVVIRAAIVDAGTTQGKVDCAALGCQVMALIGNSP